MTAKTKAKTLGAMIKAMRRASDHSLRDAGQLMGVSHEAVAKWEAGDVVPIRAALRAIALYLDISLEDAREIRTAQAER